MNKKNLSVISILLFFCLSAVGVVVAQTQIGVSAGASFTYSVTSNSNIPQIYQVVVRPKEAQSIKVTVLSISPPNMVTINITQQFKNGTETSWVEEKDLTAASNFPMTFANLNLNDKLWSSELLSPIINETISETYPNETRQINHATIGPQEIGYDLVDYYFDRQTGMPIEIRFVESAEVSTVLTLANSSVWTVPEFPGIFAIILLLALASLVVVSFKRKNSQVK
jgi:hypothetical protein